MNTQWRAALMCVCLSVCLSVSSFVLFHIFLLNVSSLVELLLRDLEDHMVVGGPYSSYLIFGERWTLQKYLILMFVCFTYLSVFYVGYFIF